MKELHLFKYNLNVIEDTKLVKKDMNITDKKYIVNNNEYKILLIINKIN